MTELVRKKQDLKREQSQFENDKKKFGRMENEYIEFKKEKQRLKKQQKGLRQQQKYLMATTEKKSKMVLLEAKNLENEKEKVENQKNVLAQKKLHQKHSSSNVHSLIFEQREYRELKKKVTMYQDQIDSLENQNKILQRKILKHEKLARDYAEDLDLKNNVNLENQKYLISALRSKVIELQNRNKLLTKLIKRHKNVVEAHDAIRDLKSAKKIISKLVIENDEYIKRINILSNNLKRYKELARKYQVKLYKMYDDEENENEEEKDFDFDGMKGDEINEIYESMTAKIAELMLQIESLNEELSSAQSELLQFESYANEWDIKHSSDTDRSRALYSKLMSKNDKLQNKLDVTYNKLEKEKAAKLTWQDTVLGHSQNDKYMLLIDQLKEENKKLKTELGFNNKEDVKGHKAIAMDINEQFGTGLFNNLQYILMDADLNNDDMLKLKIKDKNDAIYNVVLIKDGANSSDKKTEMDQILKPIASEQKHMVKELEDIHSTINQYDDRIQRIVDILGHIKNSRNVLKWKEFNESKANKPAFDLVVSELRQINLPSSPTKATKKYSSDRHQKTMRKFAANSNMARNRRTESLESLDSVYDLSHDDGLAQFVGV